MVFGQQVRVWRAAESWGHIAWRYAAFGLLLGLVVSALYRVRLPEVPNPMLALLMAILAAALGLFVRRLLGGRVGGRFVALTSDGILVGTADTPELVPWSDVQRVFEHRGVPRLQRHSSPVPVPLEDVFADAEQRAAFVAAVHAFLDARRVRDRTTAPTTPPDLGPPHQ